MISKERNNTNQPFDFIYAIEKLAGTALFEVTDLIYVDKFQKDKWREYGTKVVLRSKSCFLNCGKNNVYLDKGGNNQI
jgi:hypothetical protein